MTETTKEPKFTSSLKWQSVNVTVQVVLQLVFIAALARLITPDDFGVMGIALIVVGFIEIFAQVGIGPALIQKAEITDNHKRTAFVISMGLGILFFTFTYALAPILAKNYNSEDLTSVLRVIALSFIISGASVVPRSLLIKHMKFKSLFFSSTIAMILGNIILGLGMAFMEFGVWSYVFALLAQNAILGICYWIAQPGPVGLKVDGFALSEMLEYGLKSTIFNIINYAAGKVDYMVVAYNTNLKLAGLYDRSSYLMGLPVTVLGKLGDSVLFSGMSMLQSDLDRLRNTVLKASHTILLIVIPLTILLVLNAESFTVLLLGEDYKEASTLVTILFICVGLRSFIKVGDASIRATNSLAVGIIIKVAFLAAIFTGVYYASSETITSVKGLIGAGKAVVAATAFQAVLMIAWMTADLKISLFKLLRTLIPGTLLSLPVLTTYFLIGGDTLSHLLPDTVIELQMAIIIACHILLAGLLSLILTLAFPTALDGSFPGLRYSIAGKLPSSFIKQRLSK